MDKVNDLLKRSASEINKLRKRLSSVDESIAIVSLDCRFPGSANGPDAFWSIIMI